MSMSPDNPNYADPDYPYPERRRDEDQEYDRWRDAELSGDCRRDQTPVYTITAS